MIVEGNQTDNVSGSGEISVVKTNIVSEGDSMMHGDEPQCVFSRGICKIHKLKGDKKTVSTKKWKKKKYGYGWVTVKETQYSCGYRAGNATEYQEILVSEDNCKSPVMNIGDSNRCSDSIIGISREGLFMGCDASLKGKVSK